MESLKQDKIVMILQVLMGAPIPVLAMQPARQNLTVLLTQHNV